ncbi:class I glutamine amidotransferase-like protein, partial [Clavulina sp. PMI_390]
MVTPPCVFGVLLYDYVSSLDFMGPLAFINNVPGIEILLIHDTMSPILSGTPEGLPGGPFAGPTLLPSCTLESAPRLDALLIPGGSGSFTMNLDSKWTDFIAKVSPDLQYLLTVCNGTVLLAKAGVLDGKRATTNKAVFSWVESHSSKVEWVRDARWVVDGKFWTSSGVEAGTDMGYAFVASVFGEPIASEITTMLEYSPNKDPSFDPFA